MGMQHDVHEKNCNCSLCEGGHKLHYGLNIPVRWAEWNSWYSIKYWPRRYVRWTNPWMKTLQEWWRRIEMKIPG